MPFSAISCSMAALTMGLRIKRWTSVRRWDKSGPITALRVWRKCTRNTRPNLRIKRGASIFGLSLMTFWISSGSLIWTKVLRPFNKILTKRRSLLATDQESPSQIFKKLFSLFGDRPQNTLTGMILTLMSGLFWQTSIMSGTDLCKYGMARRRNQLPSGRDK